MSEMDPLEDFLLPESTNRSMIQNDPLLSGPIPMESPSRKLTSLLSFDPTIPESPDMKFARKRLGNLLTTIKHHPSEIIGVLPEDYTRGEEESTRQGRPPGRPRKMVRHESSTSLMDSPRKTMTRDSKIMFELRGKPFEMVAGRFEEEYSLGRAWVKGHMNSEYEPIRTQRTEFASNLAVEYLACREIYKMPRPDKSLPELPVRPPRQDKFDRNVDPRFFTDLKNEHVRHWKEVKKEWCAHQRRRDARYSRSIALIEKIFQPPDSKNVDSSLVH
ncbi:CBN-LIN-37 protein [Caenorhabditis brenneri]|uniref:CBN-LIN-37 protein n=1 Tax=Caenorhabditis brenneri TaxID=135651 RepID=G0MEP5_CAEBE|nr:CBN-LIN-37 protein [Caenorhabditis brenneri]